MDTIENIRKEIDRIDEQIIELLHKRLSLTKILGEKKSLTNQPIEDPRREEEVVTRLTMLGEKRGLPGSLIQNIWKYIFQHSKEKQRGLA